MSTTLKVCLLSSALSLGGIGAGVAEEAAPAAPTPAPEFKLSGYVEAGIVANTDSPRDRKNFGHLFTDYANRPVLNQAVLTAEKAIDPAVDYSLGFKAQAMYGSDARITHFLGIADSSKNRNQFDVVEANVSIHTPWLGAGGMDIKAGLYPTLLGAEVIDPNGNAFYTHSYLFNFGLPLKHAGVLTTTHVDATLDVYAGVDTGTNTTFGRKGDNNGAIAFMGGIGLNGLFGGKTTVLAATHIGAENPRGTPGVRANKDLRYFNDIVIATKVSDALTLTTEFNYVKDDGFDAAGYGVVQYAVYALSDRIGLAARAELWRDADGFYVAKFPGNSDFADFQHGYPFATAIGYGKATYGAITLGLAWKPVIAGSPVAFTLRPELRYDAVLSSGVRPYNNGTARGQFTAAIDLIAKF
jgi:hypothetical protein